MIESFVIQSDIASLPVVEERLFHFCHVCNIGNYYSVVSVAALQAVENAVVHGNDNDNAKKVNITYGTCRGGLFVEVSDEGNGFDFLQYGKLSMGEENVGEGIFIMNSLADKLEFSDGGRCVRMEFLVSGIDPAEARERVSVISSRFVLAEA